QIRERWWSWTVYRSRTCKQIPLRPGRHGELERPTCRLNRMVEEEQRRLVVYSRMDHMREVAGRKLKARGFALDESDRVVAGEMRRLSRKGTRVTGQDKYFGLEA